MMAGLPDPRNDPAIISFSPHGKNVVRTGVSTMYRKMLIAGLAIIAIPALATTAYAEDLAQIPTAADTIVAPPAIAEPAPVLTVTPTLLEDEAISDGDLGELRGGDAIVVGTQTLTAINSGTVINGNYTAGNIRISDNALSNFNGLGNLVINTGAQNNLQSAMNVTINIAP
jgi:hypothetical protein